MDDEKLSGLEGPTICLIGWGGGVNSLTTICLMRSHMIKSAFLTVYTVFMLILTAGNGTLAVIHLSHHNWLWALWSLFWTAYGLYYAKPRF